MKFMIKISLSILFVAVYAYGIGEPLQAPEDLTKAKENILAGTVGKKQSPITGVQQETLGTSDDTTDNNNDDQVGTNQKSKKSGKKVKKPTYDYKNEKILNWINATNLDIAHDNNPQAKVRSIAFRGSLEKDVNGTMKDKVLNKSLASINNRPENHLTGICIIPEEVEVAANTKGILTAFCTTPKGRFKIFGDLIPKADQYSLIANTIYVENTYGERFYVDANKSYVLNSKKNSTNIATFINTYILDKAIRESVKTNTKLLADTSTQYMNDLKASRTTQQAIMVPNAGTTVATNTAKPVISDYLSVFGIQMSSELVNQWADYAMQDHPWGFKILGDTKIYIDLMVKGAK